MITIDGGQGEGGGQILRTSLALSMITGQPVSFVNIRAGRAKPGLQRQHLACVHAAAKISGTKAAQAELGSQTLGFYPGPIRSGNYTFTIGTAGSTTLVLQTVLPALLTASAASTLTLEGGTHNPLAPPFDFLTESFLPLIARQGPQVTARLEQYGFAPEGGGKFHVLIEPVEKLGRLDLLERGNVIGQEARVLIGGLPTSIAERELAVVQRELQWPKSNCFVQELQGRTGNALLLKLRSESLTEVMTGFGQRGRPAEAVADEAVGQMRRLLESGAPVGEYLADQLLLPIALAGGGSFVTSELSLHSRTNMEVIRRFLDVEFEVTEQSAGTMQVDCIAA